MTHVSLSLDASDEAYAEDEQRIKEVLATMEEICTQDAPQVTDPATWNEAGKAVMDMLEADPVFQQAGFTASAASDADVQAAQRKALAVWDMEDAVTLPDPAPYLIAVNRAADTVTIYTIDSEGRYTVPYMAMVCSTGSSTPTGFYYTPIDYSWRTLYGPAYGQYCTRIVDAILFHTVPYNTPHKDDLEYEEFNLLGTPASMGCIRLMVGDVKWIYDSCPIGTPVVIYDDAENPGPMGKPGTIYSDPNDVTLRGWDPTDPDPANPWDDKYLIGTTIRSDAAWEEYDVASTSGAWLSSLTKTDLLYD